MMGKRRKAYLFGFVAVVLAAWTVNPIFAYLPPVFDYQRDEDFRSFPPDGPVPQGLVSKNVVYVPGSVQMIAPANVVRYEIITHPQGRYVLVVQRDTDAYPNEPLDGGSRTGNTTLVLYDARLRKTRTLWEHQGYVQVRWLPGTDCAVATVDNFDAPPHSPSRNSVLFFDFEKSLSARVLVSEPEDFKVFVSPIQPVFMVEGRQIVTGSDQQASYLPYYRMGMGPSGKLGPVLLDERLRFFTDPVQWSITGTSVYGSKTVYEQTTPDAQPREVAQWYEWDGKTPNATLLREAPTKTRLVIYPSPPLLSLALRTTEVSVSLPPLTPQTTPAQTKVPQISPSNEGFIPTPPALHPLFLECPGDAPVSSAQNRFVFLAPDADEALLLPDQSTVLYLLRGALYAVPLKQVPLDVFKHKQRKVALSVAQVIGESIGYYVDEHGEYPPQKDIANTLHPY